MKQSTIIILIFFYSFRLVILFEHVSCREISFCVLGTGVCYGHNNENMLAFFSLLPLLFSYGENKNLEVMFP